jgi:hypothetical protein
VTALLALGGRPPVNPSRRTLAKVRGGRKNAPVPQAVYGPDGQ